MVLTEQLINFYFLKFLYGVVTIELRQVSLAAFVVHELFAVTSDDGIEHFMLHTTDLVELVQSLAIVASVRLETPCFIVFTPKN